MTKKEICACFGKNSMKNNSLIFTFNVLLSNISDSERAKIQEAFTDLVQKIVQQKHCEATTGVCYIRDAIAAEQIRANILVILADYRFRANYRLWQCAVLLKNFCRCGQISQSGVEETFTQTGAELLIDGSRLLNPGFVNRVSKLIEQDLSISLVDAAKHMSVTKSYLCSELNRNIGCTFSELLNTERILRAASELSAATDIKTIDVLAYECHFNSIQYFNRIFKKYTGITPGTFRRYIREYHWS